jgi:septum formation protein
MGFKSGLAFIAIHKMEGSYFNVAGLPIHKLYKELMDL